MSELGKLKWQCRRGSLELDLILEKYLETKFLTANDKERQQFFELLALEDIDLLEAMKIQYNS